MPVINFQRTVEDLYKLASMFWPSELNRLEAERSVIPKLLETQEQFVAILSVDVSDLDSLFQIIDAATLPANLFLKHLVVLSDFGGEMLQRTNREFNSLFPASRLDYLWNEKKYSYDFKRLPLGNLTNSRLGLTGKKLIDAQPLSDLTKDVVALLLFGSACEEEKVSETLVKCEIGNYLSQPEILEKFIKQRYIWVSRITAGAKANTLGQIAQSFVKAYIENNLGIEGISIRTSGSIPGVSHTSSDRPTTFDLVISAGNKYVAIEVSFQVTTNSTIERKAGQARARFEQVEKEGYKIAYVIDGAGNFQRENAIRTLCSYSHCTVAFSESELSVLCEFLRAYFSETI